MGKRFKRCTLVFMLLICKSLSWKSPCLLLPATRNVIFSSLIEDCLCNDSRFSISEEKRGSGFSSAAQDEALVIGLRVDGLLASPLSAGGGCPRQGGRNILQVLVSGISG